MELALFVYLAGVVSSVGGFMLFIAISLFMALVGYIMAYTMQSSYSSDKWEFKKKYILVPVIAGLIASMIPSEKTMYMMLAGYTAQTVVQSDTADKVLKVINSKLDGYLEEATTSKEKK